MILLGLAAGVPVPRMYYTNFDRAITEKYHVILEGWPLEKFCSPSEIASRNEVSVLMASFESGATHFRKLSPTEFEKWSEERHNAAVESMTGPVATVTSSSPLPPDPAPTQDVTSSSPLPPDSAPTQEPPVPVPSAPLPGSQDSISNEGTAHTGALTEVDLDPDVENVPPSSNPAKRKRSHAEPSTSRRPLTNTFINSGVTSTNGTTIMVNGKARKPRTDKGKKRGPRAK
jgi:hypothetical protein